MATRSAVFIMAAALGAQDGPILCGTPELTRAQARSVQRQIEATVRAHEQLRLPWPKRIEIPVVFHITNPEIPDSKVVSELARVNRSFKSRGFHFPLQEIKRYNPDNELVAHFRKNCFDEDENWMFKAFAYVDPRTALNVYTCDPVPHKNPVGYATWPWDGGEHYYEHSVTIQHIWGWPYLEHEIGHYLGLLHTFEGGCDPHNDYVPDTPAQRKPFARKCNPRRDSCRKLPGRDPVANFMGYGEGCYDNFTDGQQIRIHYMMMTYRPTLWMKSL